MVEDRVTDGRRIAQMFASELTGLDRGPLGAVEVVDAVRNVEPSPQGAQAYDVAVDGNRIATVTVTPSSARIEFENERDVSLPDRDDGLDLESCTGGSVLVIASAAAVKRAVDVLTAALE